MDVAKDTTKALRVRYDETFDVLELFFQDPVPALTVELEEDVYAHIVPGTTQVIGLTIHHFRAHHANFNFPFQGILNPSTPTAAANIRKALVPA